MGGMWLPTLAGLARLSPIRIITDRVNIAGTTTTTEYTVPAGRMALITTMAIEQRGGVAYTHLGFTWRIAAAGTPGVIVMAAPAGNFFPIGWEGWVWLTETDDLRSQVRGGDATSDYRITILGGEFDWAESDDLD